MNATALGSMHELEEGARRRMERWILSPELQACLEAGDAAAVRRDLRFGPFITLSRQAGAGGGEVARLVGRRLGWDVLDKELLDFLAHRYGMPRDMLEFVDETKANWLHDLLGSWFDARVVSQESYVMHLERVLLMAALHGRIVVVGRGAYCILPRSAGLAVRIVAPEAMRIERTARLEGISRDEAARKLQRIETGRNQFCRFYFHKDNADPQLFDLVINREQFSPEAAADLIVAAFERLHGKPEPATLEP